MSAEGTGNGGARCDAPASLPGTGAEEGTAGRASGKRGDPAAWAYFYYGGAGSVKKCMCIHSALEAAGVAAWLDPTPEWISSDCGVVVRVEKKEKDAAREVLSRAGIDGYNEY